MRHPEEKRQTALESIAKIGVKKTHEATGISMQTLYKWKNEGKKASPAKAPAAVSEKVKAAKAVVKASDDQLLEKIAQVEAENAKLRDTNEKLKKALLTFIGE